MIDFFKKHEKKIWYLSLIAVFIATGCLFYFYCNRYNVNTELYQSDFESHIRTGVKGKGYSLQGRIIHLLYYLGREKVYLIAAFVSLVILLTIAAIYYFFLELDKLTGNNGNRPLYRWAALSLVFLGPLTVPGVWPYFYKNQFNINAWHNGTYMEMRLFAILTLTLYLRIERSYLTKKMKAGELILFSLCLAIATLFKPSFFMGFSFVMAFGLLADLLRRPAPGNEMSFSEKFKKILLFGSMVLPTCAIAILQYNKLFGFKTLGTGAAAPTSKKQSGITFDIARYFKPTSTVWIRILLFLPIPLLILLYNRKKWKQPEYKWYRFCFWLTTLEFLFWFCLKETGYRADAGNFGWGRRIGQFIWVMSSLYLLSNNYREKSVTGKDRAYKITLTALWLYQLACGLVHFGYILTGEYYNM